MLCGIELSNDFSQEMGALNLDVFLIRNFIYPTSLGSYDFFGYWNSLKTLYLVYPETLYLVHPNVMNEVYPPDELKKLVIYCPK